MKIQTSPTCSLCLVTSTFLHISGLLKHQKYLLWQGMQIVLCMSPPANLKHEGFASPVHFVSSHSTSFLCLSNLPSSCISQTPSTTPKNKVCALFYMHITVANLSLNIKSLSLFALYHLSHPTSFLHLSNHLYPVSQGMYISPHAYYHPLLTLALDDGRQNNIRTPSAAAH